MHNFQEVEILSAQNSKCQVSHGWIQTCGRNLQNDENEEEQKYGAYTGAILKMSISISNSKFLSCK